MPRIDLLAIALGAAVTAPVATTTPKLPDWMQLKAGRAAYFGPGAAPTLPACPTLKQYLTFIKLGEQTRSALCPTMESGQRVTILTWTEVSVGPDLVAPIVHIQFEHTRKTAWTGVVAPVVPEGAIVAITGSECDKEASRDHVTVSKPSIWLAYCKGVVTNQLVSSKHNVLMVRLLRSGDVAQVDANTAFLPDALYANGMPRYTVARFPAQ